MQYFGQFFLLAAKVFKSIKKIFCAVLAVSALIFGCRMYLWLRTFQIGKKKGLRSGGGE
jgi:hypothetical protein